MDEADTPGSESEFVGERTGFQVVEPDESVIYVSESPGGGMFFSL